MKALVLASSILAATVIPAAAEHFVQFQSTTVTNTCRSPVPLVQWGCGPLLPGLPTWQSCSSIGHTWLLYNYFWDQSATITPGYFCYYWACSPATILLKCNPVARRTYTSAKTITLRAKRAPQR
jgi:hypothetical protein